MHGQAGGGRPTSCWTAPPRSGQTIAHRPSPLARGIHRQDRRGERGSRRGRLLAGVSLATSGLGDPPTRGKRLLARSEGAAGDLRGVVPHRQRSNHRGCEGSARITRSTRSPRSQSSDHQITRSIQIIRSPDRSPITVKRSPDADTSPSPGSATPPSACARRAARGPVRPVVHRQPVVSRSGAADEGGPDPRLARPQRSHHRRGGDGQGHRRDRRRHLGSHHWLGTKGVQDVEPMNKGGTITVEGPARHHDRCRPQQQLRRQRHRLSRRAGGLRREARERPDDLLRRRHRALRRHEADWRALQARHRASCRLAIASRWAPTPPRWPRSGWA